MRKFDYGIFRTNNITVFHRDSARIQGSRQASSTDASRRVASWTGSAAVAGSRDASGSYRAVAGSKTGSSSRPGDLLPVSAAAVSKPASTSGTSLKGGEMIDIGPGSRV